MKKLKSLGLILLQIVSPFAGPSKINNGMGPASEGNPTGYFH